jgi:hypothetical protein
MKSSAMGGSSSSSSSPGSAAGRFDSRFFRFFSLRRKAFSASKHAGGLILSSGRTMSSSESSSFDAGSGAVASRINNSVASSGNCVTRPMPKRRTMRNCSSTLSFGRCVKASKGSGSRRSSWISTYHAHSPARAARPTAWST